MRKSPDFPQADITNIVQGSGAAPVGVLMLDTRFPRILGDIGHPGSWPVPVVYHRVAKSSAAVALGDNPEVMLPEFVHAGWTLIDQGACCLTTSCGFLTLFQDELRAQLGVPVLCSSLMQVRQVNQCLPKNRYAGILTISKNALTKAHLDAADVPRGTPVEGLPEEASFVQTIMTDSPDLDKSDATQVHVNAALKLQRAHPRLGAIVLECTNMGPYADAIRQATQLPVYSIIDAVSWMYSGLMRRGCSSV